MLYKNISCLARSFRIRFATFGHRLISLHTCSLTMEKKEKEVCGISLDTEIFLPLSVIMLPPFVSSL